MTREEEIINAGVEYTESKRPVCIGGQSYSYEIFQMHRNYAFEDGAKWADKTMIEKACEWLSKTLYVHTEEIEDKHWNETKTFDWVTSDYDSVRDFIDGFEFIDENGNVITSKKIKLERKKPQYPKTYEECCEVLGWDGGATVIGYNAELIGKLQRLKLCRDAYWKIVGGWKHDLNNCKVIHYSIVNHKGNITKCSRSTVNAILSFPTEEMRDAFYENFKELIEECKELL